MLIPPCPTNYAFAGPTFNLSHLTKATLGSITHKSRIIHPTKHYSPMRPSSQPATPMIQPLPYSNHSNIVHASHLAILAPKSQHPRANEPALQDPFPCHFQLSLRNQHSEILIDNITSFTPHHTYAIIHGYTHTRRKLQKMNSNRFQKSLHTQGSSIVRRGSWPSTQQGGIRSRLLVPYRRAYHFSFDIDMYRYRCVSVYRFGFIDILKIFLIYIHIYMKNI